MMRLGLGERRRISCTVNGVARSGFAEGRTLLSDFLRHELNLYGTHVGCEHGVCGACTVILDGRLARSCGTLAMQADGAEITTIEGLGDSDREPALREAFSRHGALQCGFCTAGVLLSVKHFLQHNPKPSDGEIRDMLSGHLCRCTGYEGMVRAIAEVAEGQP
ncbi:MAG: (2Fe-2S)-binding protein [Alphaproteobacteria bacterium]|nr:(2Fe-2S)-binding protein [Alphaproteobacteria bacterium]MDP6872078.1 (2Fe-2S)-binding protein [Alphaproteobacteria bacterium]